MTEMNHFDEKKQLKYGSVLSYVLVFLNIALGLIYTPWILREIGDSHYGLYTLASTLTAMFLLDFGMSAAITRFLSKYRAENKNDRIDSFVGLSVKLYIYLTIILALIFIVIYFLVERIYVNLTPEEISVFKNVFIIVAFFLVTCFPVNICNGILNAYEEFIWLRSADLINKLGTVVTTVIVLLMDGGIYGLVFVNGLFNLITFVLKIYLVKKLTPVKIHFEKFSLSTYGELVSFSFWVTIQTIFQQFIFNVVPSILAMVLNTASITLYGFANVIEGYVYNISSAINGMFMPRISRLVVDSDDASNTINLMIKVGRITLSITSLLIIGLVTLGKEFVNVWVGSRYSNLYYCILFLSIPYVISSTQIIAENSLVALNKVKFSSIIKIVVGVANVIGVYCIAPKYGVIGVCAVTGGAFIINIILSNVVYKFVLKLDILSFFCKCHGKMLLGIALSFLAAYVIKLLIPAPAEINKLFQWGLFAAKAIVITLAYFVIMWIFAWNADEKKLIKDMIIRK